MYPQLLTTSHEAGSEQDRPEEGIWVRLVQAEGKDEIVSLKEQIMQLQVVIQRPPQ